MVTEVEREIVPDGFEQPKQADTWRFGRHDGQFAMYFGSWEDDRTVRVHASIHIPDDRIDRFATSFIQAVMSYCDRKGIELQSFKLSEDEDDGSRRGEEGRIDDAQPE